MSGLVTVARYRAITGDETSVASAVEERITDATARLEERLDRPLAEAERSEAMYPGRDGRVYPHAIPITAAAGYTIDGYSLRGGWWSLAAPIDDPLGTQIPPVITYTGGWVERTANPTATNRLPVCIEEDLAWAAYALLHPATIDASVVPVGATSVRLGDAAIGYGPKGAPRPNHSGIVWSAATLAWRYRRVAGS